MAVLFYDHLVPWQKAEASVKALNLPRDEEHQVLGMIEEVVHTEILMVILTHLPDHQHHEFLDQFHQSPYSETHLIYLQTHAHPEIHLHIEQKGHEVIELLLTDRHTSIFDRLKRLLFR